MDFCLLTIVLTLLMLIISHYQILTTANFNVLGCINFRKKTSPTFFYP